MPSRELIKLEAKVKTTRFTFYLAFIVGIAAFLYLFHGFMGGDLVQFFTTLDTIFIVFPPFVPAALLYLMLRGAEKKYNNAVSKELAEVKE